MKKNLLSFFLLFVFHTLTIAQSITPQTFNVCGNYVNAGYYQFEWSVGEMSITETFENSIFGYLTNGVLQPLTDNPTFSFIDNNWNRDEIRILPSPTTGLFEVNILTKQQGRLEIQLVDNLGQSIKTISDYYYGIGRIERFDISRYASANYLLRISLSPNPGYSAKKGGFKILKIN